MARTDQPIKNVKEQRRHQQVRQRGEHADGGRADRKKSIKSEEIQDDRGLLEALFVSSEASPNQPITSDKEQRRHQEARRQGDGTVFSGGPSCQKE